MYMRKSKKSSTYIQLKMLKIFLMAPSRQGCSYLIGHNIGKRSCLIKNDLETLFYKKIHFSYGNLTW